MIMASTPIMTLIAGRAIAGDGISGTEEFAICAITVGILNGAFFRLHHRTQSQSDNGRLSALVIC
jgi:hypothetical protein